jgi:hypothetical protein
MTGMVILIGPDQVLMLNPLVEVQETRKHQSKCCVSVFIHQSIEVLVRLRPNLFRNALMEIFSDIG